MEASAREPLYFMSEGAAEWIGLKVTTTQNLPTYADAEIENSHFVILGIA
jgi:hypothetical protein